jgi:glycosyltransferase involved in cell wall biosynthesis
MKVSIALCTYNGEQYICNQLNSILNQSFPVNEIIVCDDASTDATIQILEDYKARFPGVITIYKNSINKGTIRNFENAITLTRGEIIFLSDQDDIWNVNNIILP